jgi:hypothetical protein
VIDCAIKDFYEAPVSISRRDVVKIVKLADRFDFHDERFRFVDAVDYALERTVNLLPVHRIIAFIVINIIEND